MGVQLASSSSLIMLMVMMILMSSTLMNMCFSYPTCQPTYPPHAVPTYEEDVDLLQFAENLEHLEADFFLWGALGFGLDKVAPQLVMGGPAPIGVQKANLDSLTHSIIYEFGFEEVGHLRALKSTVGGFPRPLMDLSAHNFAKLFDEAFGYQLRPAFDPYRDSLSYMLGSYVIPYMGLVGYVGANPLLNGYKSKRLLAGLLGVEAGQDAVIRMYLYERAEELLRNNLAMCGIKDEGIIVPPELGAENRTETNVLSSNFDSISYKRTPAEILRVLYDTGDEHKPGGFFPHGANGKIAGGFLKMPY
ncbi:unnamed protein product [Camellia sinensis]